MNSVTVIAEIRPLDCFRILCLLNVKGISGAEVARIIGAEQSTVRYWRIGKRHPQDPHARRLAALFDLYYPNTPIPQISDASHAQETVSAV